MAIVKDTVLYIGADIYRALSEKEQESFETVERYKPDALSEQMENFDEQGWTGRTPLVLSLTWRTMRSSGETTGLNVVDSSTREFLIT